MTWLTEEWVRRPWWMNLTLIFCAYMTFVYMPFDLFWKDVAVDKEVWFGFTLSGWNAKMTEPLHWIIYAAGFWGLLKMRPWAWYWGVIYTGQVVIAMFVWNLLDENGGGWIPAVVSASLFLLLLVAFWRSRPKFLAANA